MNTDKENLLLAINAALEAGEEVDRIYNEGFEVVLKADNSPVTEADLASDAIIRRALAPSGLEVISEEVEQLAYNDRKHFTQYWCVDPIDGTKGFVNKTGNFCICIALIKEQTAFAGVIYLPTTKVLYYGMVGWGAFKANQEKNVATLDDLYSAAMPTQKQPERFTVLATNYHMNHRTQEHIDKLKEEKPEMEIKRVSSAIKFCMLADGEAHHYPRYGKMNDWDLAAGHAILEAAGGAIEPTNGKPFTYNDEKLYREDFMAWMRKGVE